MTDNDFNLSPNPIPEPEADAYGKVKDAKTDKGADVYLGLDNAHMSFDGIKCLEVAGPDIVLRGRNGQRDVLFPLEKATQKYLDWMDIVYAYARNGIHGWDTMMDLANEFKARICEAVAVRKKLGMEVPADAQKLVDASQAKPRQVQF